MKFLERVKSRVSHNTFATWFQPTRLNRMDGDTLFIQIPTTVFRQVLTRTYGDIIRAVFLELGMPQLKVQFVCTEEEPVQAAPDNASGTLSSAARTISELSPPISTLSS